MPRLNDDSMEEQKTIGTFGFSGTRIDDLGATEYTLCTILIDASGSVSPFAAGLEKALKETIRACQLSPRADNLMVRVVKFNDSFEELHGFKLLDKINLDDYNNVLRCGGMTLLHDSVINAMEATGKYSKDLVTNDFQCNAIVVVLTDGDDNRSKFGKESVKKSIKSLVTSEALESLVSILVGVNVKEPVISAYLKDLKDQAEFDQYVELDNADSRTLAKLADFVSKSISSQSNSLGSGGKSQSLSF
jgi:uncharacterized protein YegL